MDNPIQTPSRGRTASRGLLETPSLASSRQDAPDSQVSIDSQAIYSFWNSDQQSRDDGPLTPITPPSLGDYQTKKPMFMPQFPQLKKSKSASQLSTHPFHASESNAGEKCTRATAEENETGWLFGEYSYLYQDELLRDFDSPNRACPPSWLDSTEADFWSGTDKRRPKSFILSRDCQFDFSFSRQTTPLREADPRVLNRSTTTRVTAKHRQTCYTRFEKTDGVQNDSPTPSPSRDSHPHKAEAKQLITSSETVLTTENRSINAKDGFGRVQQQSDSSVRVQGQEIYRRTNETNQRVSELDVSKRLLARTTVSSSILRKILPFNIRERLLEDPHRCVASLTRKPDQRCLNKAYGPYKTITQYLGSLSDAGAYSDHRKTLQCIEGLIDSALCKGSHRKVATRELETWRVILDRLSKNQEHSQTQRDRSAAEMTAFTVWIEALTGAVLSTTKTHRESAHQVTFSDRTTQPISKIEITSAEASIEATKTRGLMSLKGDSATITTTVQSRETTKLHYIQDFQLYQPKSTSHLSIPQALHRILTRPLKPRELKPGHIYIYWFPGNFGYVKIGITMRDDVNERLKEWIRGCKHEVESHPVEDMSRQVAVPHVFRVEALVHAELKDMRYKEVGCKGCGRNHVEWFFVHLKHATSVVKKWSHWMMNMPYEARSEEEGSEWKLKGSIGEDDIKKLCQPLEQPVPVPVVKHDVGRQLRRSSRKNVGKRRVSAAT